MTMILFTWITKNRMKILNVTWSFGAWYHLPYIYSWMVFVLSCRKMLVVRSTFTFHRIVMMLQLLNTKKNFALYYTKFIASSTPNKLCFCWTFEIDLLFFRDILIAGLFFPCVRLLWFGYPYIQLAFKNLNLHFWKFCQLRLILIQNLTLRDKVLFKNCNLLEEQKRSQMQTKIQKIKKQPKRINVMNVCVQYFAWPTVPTTLTPWHKPALTFGIIGSSSFDKIQLGLSKLIRHNKMPCRDRLCARYVCLCVEKCQKNLCNELNFSKN